MPSSRWCTLIGLQLPILVGGSVIMENIFNLPGLGRLLLNALNDRDYPMVSGIKPVLRQWGRGNQSAHRPDLRGPGPQGPL